MSLPIKSKKLEEQYSKLQKEDFDLWERIFKLTEQRDALDEKIKELEEKRRKVRKKMLPLQNAIRVKKKKNPRPYYTYEPVMGDNTVKGELMEMGDIVTYYGRYEYGEEAKITIIRGRNVEIYIKNTNEKVIAIRPEDFLKLKSRNGVKSKDGATLPRKRKRDSEQAGNVGSTSSSNMYLKY